ncbi:MAG: hypothetical protein SO125_01885 [Eubacteriales bacterium]|nr:hypothetical protein [Eubacteriales bacterium]
MKKALLILLALTMIMSMTVLAPVSASAADEETAVGSVAADYKPEGTAVTTAEEFAAMDAEGQYYLAADITLNSTYVSEFKGTLDGGGHTIYLSVPAFDTFSGNVKNLILDVSDRIITGGDGETGFAAFACKTNGMTAVNVCNMAHVYSGANNVAGFVAEAYGTTKFENCANYGSITTTVGAVAGFLAYGNDVNLTFINCVNDADIANTETLKAAAGIVALTGTWSSTDTSVCTTFENCVNNGDILGGAQVGGIAGFTMMNAVFMKCTNTGKVYGNQQKANLALDSLNKAHEGAYCGGIVSRCGNDKAISAKDVKSILTDCKNFGEVISDRDQVGGITAFSKTSYYATNCVNKGLVMLDMGPGEHGYAAGILASLAHDTKGVTTCLIESCVNDGTIIADNRVGGILGTAGGKKHNASANGYRVTKCANTGDIYSYAYYLDAEGNIAKVSGTAGAGGIIGYIYGSKSSTNQVGFVEYCTNTGNLYSSQFCSPWFAYTNELNTVIKFCVFGGTMNKIGYISDYTTDIDLKADIETKDDPAIKHCFALMGCSSAHYDYFATYDSEGKAISLSRTILDDSKVSATIPGELLLADNYILDSCGLDYFNYALEDKNSSNRIGIDVAISSGLVTVVDESKFTSGELTFMMNEKIGETVFYQNVNDRIFTQVDKCPTTDATHAKIMYSAIEGKYINLLFDMNPEGTPATGDATVYVVITLAVSAVALAGLVISKKRKVRN